MSEPKEGIKLPPVPTFDLTRVLNTRDKLADFATGYVGTRPAGEEFNDLVRGVVSLLPDGVNAQAVFGSMAHLAGTLLTLDGVVALCWRLAGNVSLLKTGRVVLPTTWQGEARWAALQISTVRPLMIYPDDRDRRKVGAQITFCVLAGPPASVTFKKFWSRELIRYYARRAGFSAPWKPDYYTDERELVNFRLTAYVDPAMSRDGTPNFRHMHVTSSMMAWNKAIIKMRRRSGYQCPRRYELTQACFSCPAGQTSCEAACHAVDYAPGTCPRCGKLSWFDPDPEAFNRDVCVVCGLRSDTTFAVKPQEKKK